jgi:hypothetical protein
LEQLKLDPLPGFSCQHSFYLGGKSVLELISAKGFLIHFFFYFLPVLNTKVTFCMVPWVQEKGIEFSFYIHYPECLVNWRDCTISFQNFENSTFFLPHTHLENMFTLFSAGPGFMGNHMFDMKQGLTLH